MADKVNTIVARILADGGLALSIAAVVDGLLALAFTLIFARVLGPGGYGSLAALVSVFLIGLLVGSALQMTVARRLASAGPGPAWSIQASAANWLRWFSVAAVVALLVCVLVRDDLAGLIGVKEPWAAAIIVPAALLDIAASLQRGLLLGRGAYRLAAASTLIVPAGWLVFGMAFAEAGMGLNGIVAGIGVTEICCVLLLRAFVRRLPEKEDGAPGLSVNDLVREAGGQIVTLALFAMLQNLDVVAVRRSVADDALASSYAAAAVAGKAILWVAIGVGQHLLPEAAKDPDLGGNGRRLLLRGVRLVCCAAVPTILLFAIAGGPLLGFVFGPNFTAGAKALPPLAIAMTLLATSYLCLQLLIAHDNYRFLPFLAGAAILQPVVILLAAPDLRHISLGIAALNLAITISLLLAVLRPQRSVGVGS